MKKDTIYNFKSLLTVKDRTSFLVRSNFFIKEKNIKIKNSFFIKGRTEFKITEYFRDYKRLKTTNAVIEKRIPILFKHTIFSFYLNKYKITNKQIIKDIEEYYRITKVFVEMFNQKYSYNNHFELEINHDVIFSILKYNELKITDLELYKKEKIENIFSEELYKTIRRL